MVMGNKDMKMITSRSLLIETGMGF